MPEAWLKGPVEGVPAALQPVAHAFLGVELELGRLLRDASDDELWRRPGGAAAIGFHIRHFCGSADRLLTYARGEMLNDEQLAELEDEKNPSARRTRAELAELVRTTLARALTQLRQTDERTLDEPRAVGRKRLPSTVRGLLFHAAEHAARHTGQAVTTMKIIRGTG